MAFREQGERRFHSWGTEGTVLESLRAVLEKARGREQVEKVDSFEIDIAHSFREESYENLATRKNKPNQEVGVRGIEVRLGEHFARFAPSWMLASNRKFGRQIDVWAEDWKVERSEMKEASYRTFDAEQVLVILGEEDARAVLMERGNIYVKPRTVDRESTKNLADLQIRWLTHNVHADGRMTYLWWPTQEREAPRRNNMIRQWMATVALGRVAAEREDEAIWALAEKNIDYNLKAFYRDEGEYGLIEFRDKVKLGAIALAAYSMLHHPSARSGPDKSGRSSARW